MGTPPWRACVRPLFSRFKDTITRFGVDAATMPGVVVQRDAGHYLVYTPFEGVNPHARLCLVGITPGPTQVIDAYGCIRSLAIRAEDPADFEKIKRYATFSGSAVRPNLVKLLDGTGVTDLMGLESGQQLWEDAGAHLLHATSVVPHAAFSQRGSPFNGSFAEVLKSKAMRSSFEKDFVPSLQQLPADCLFIGLGPTPHEALKWCVQRKLIPEGNILGSFPHPSGNGGSQTDLYLGLRSMDSLKPNDPVRHRGYLLEWAAELRARVDELRAAPSLAPAA